MSQKLVEVKNVCVNIGRKKILDNINLELQKGEAVLIAGRNGAGKSTLLKCLANVILPDKGSIKLSREIAGSKIGIISDHLSLFENFTLKQGINFHTAVFRINDFDYTLIDELKMDLNQKIKYLSAGERTLYHLSLIMAQKPDILLLDEIIHVIDPYMRERFLEAVIDLMDMYHPTVVMVNHTFSEIEKIPDRVLVMENGQFILDEERETLGEKLKKVTTEKEISEEIPCVFKRESSYFKEYYIYPFNEELNIKFPDDYKNINLNEIVKAFVGGQYVKKRIQ